MLLMNRGIKLILQGHEHSIMFRESKLVAFIYFSKYNALSFKIAYTSLTRSVLRNCFDNSTL